MEKDTKTPNSVISNSTLPVTPRLYKALQEMRAALEEEFGKYYAFSVNAQGHVLAASNAKDGIIIPVKET